MLSADHHGWWQDATTLIVVVTEPSAPAVARAMGQRWPQATCVEVLARDNQILSLIIEAHPECKLEARQKLSPAQWTGDADLGIRASQRGYTVGVICSTTYEEANCHVQNWLWQRSRWIKGCMQTWLVTQANWLEMQFLPWSLRT
jgi:hypothetical protein